MGHLYKGGMWFKKTANISEYNPNTAVDGTDWRTTGNSQSWSVSQTLLSAADTGNYFYLPALGNYYSGQLNFVGDLGFYWSSSAYPGNTGYAYSLNFNSSTIYVGSNRSDNGFRVEPTFE